MQFTQLKRREFITLLGGATAWPMSARAQSSPMRRVGVLTPFAENDPEHANVAAFRQALEKLGWTNGGNVRVDYRWGGADPARIRAQAKEIVAFKTDVILVSTALALQPLLQETRSIPIVVTRIVDPVGAGFVASLARPGGNLTGFTVAEFSLFGKLVEVLKEIAPQVTRVAVLLHPDQVPQTRMLQAVEAAAKSIGVKVTAAGARDSAAVERAVNEFAREPGGGLIVFPKRGDRRKSETDHRDSCPAPLACGVWLPVLRRGRRLDLLRRRSCRPIPAGCFIRRPHPPRRKTSRFASSATDQVRVGAEPQNSKSARP